MQVDPSGDASAFQVHRYRASQQPECITQVAHLEADLCQSPDGSIQVEQQLMIALANSKGKQNHLNCSGKHLDCTQVSHPVMADRAAHELHVAESGPN